MVESYSEVEEARADKRANEEEEEEDQRGQGRDRRKLHHCWQEQQNDCELVKPLPFAVSHSLMPASAAFNSAQLF